MKQHYLLLSSLAIFVAALLVLGSHAYADDTGQFNDQIQVIHAHRAQMESQLGLDPQADTYTYPHATSYYDDLVDHYEHDQLTRDVIDKGLL